MPTKLKFCYRLFIYLCFLLVIAHVVFNYFAVTSLKIETLNEDRFYSVIGDYILNHEISTVGDINKRECVLIFLEKPGNVYFFYSIQA